MLPLPFIFVFKCRKLASSVSSDQHGVKESLAFGCSLPTWQALVRYFGGLVLVREPAVFPGAMYMCVLLTIQYLFLCSDVNIL